MRTAQPEAPFDYLSPRIPPSVTSTSSAGPATRAKPAVTARARPGAVHARVSVNFAQEFSVLLDVQLAAPGLTRPTGVARTPVS